MSTSLVQLVKVWNYLAECLDRNLNLSLINFMWILMVICQFFYKNMMRFLLYQSFHFHLMVGVFIFKSIKIKTLNHKDGNLLNVFWVYFVTMFGFNFWYLFKIKLNQTEDIGIGFVHLQWGKGTGSFSKRRNKTHTLCIRCGRRGFHLQRRRCSACAYPPYWNWYDEVLA